MSAFQDFLSELRQFFESPDRRSLRFRNAVRYYNSSLAMTSMIADLILREVGVHLSRCKLLVSLLRGKSTAAATALCSLTSTTSSSA